MTFLFPSLRMSKITFFRFSDSFKPAFSSGRMLVGRIKSLQNLLYGKNYFVINIELNDQYQYDTLFGGIRIF